MRGANKRKWSSRYWNPIGVYWGAYLQKDPQVLVEAHRELFAWFDEGALRPHISAAYPIETGVEAIRALAERRTTGKVVLTMGAGA